MGPIQAENRRPLTGNARRRGLAPVALALALAVSLGIVAAGPSERASAAGPPSVLVILTDDQRLSDMSAMPETQSLIGGDGATFRRAYVSFPLCCPSRASILTGLYMHNHGVRGNGGTYGGWGRFKDGVGEASALPVKLDGPGYYSTLIGKYFNGYNAASGFHVPPGWDEWYGRLGGEAKVYYDYTLLEQGPSGIPAPVYYGFDEDDYSTDVLTAKAIDFIERSGSFGQPFFLNLSYSSPHHPFTPARRDIYRRGGIDLSKRAGFNERNIKDKPRWLRQAASHRFGPGERIKIVDQQKRREETLAGVDESIAGVLHALEVKGILDDTYVIFTSDNGLFRGEHRITGGKYLPYEPSAHVPLMIRGPGIPGGGVSDELVSNVDIGQTVLDIAGAADPAVDGRSLLPYAQDPVLRTSRPILLEGDTGPGRGIGGGFDPDLLAGKSAVAVRKAGLAKERGVGNLDQEKLAGKAQATGDRAPAYRAIRTDRFLYVLYASGDRELYDMQRDPAQLRSVIKDPRYAATRLWLFTNLLELIDCQGQDCRDEIGEPPAPASASRR